MNAINNCCPPASVSRFIALEAVPKVGLGIVTLIAVTAIGALTMYLFGGGDFIKEEGFGPTECILYLSIGTAVVSFIGAPGFCIYKGVEECRKKYLDWRENDINNPTPDGNAIEMTETPQPV